MAPEGSFRGSLPSPGRRSPVASAGVTGDRLGRLERWDSVRRGCAGGGGAEPGGHGRRRGVFDSFENRAQEKGKLSLEFWEGKPTLLLVLLAPLLLFGQG